MTPPIPTPPMGEVLLRQDDLALPRPALDQLVQQTAETLGAAPRRVVATLLDNSAAWAVLDLALAEAGLVHLPIPGFFTAPQIAHVLQASGADALITAAVMDLLGLTGTPRPLTLAGTALALHTLAARPVPLPLPAGTQKITFTSGTTGNPKGVCLGAAGLDQVAQGLVQALAPLDIRRHLCALPLPVLLENVAGLLAPLAAGAECVVLPLARLGLEGSSRFDPATFHAAVMQTRPHSLILLPQMLRAWAGWLAATGQRAPASLRLVAVGGAAVGETLLLAARQVGIPAHEGYGLSEGSSVQTLNLPGADRAGSAGRPLPHARVHVDDRGQIHVAGSLMLGYLGDNAPAPVWWPTGDVGHLDEDGFLHVRGRLRHVLITAFGRNVSPEWVETTLRGQPAIAQAVVFGEARPHLSAVLWPLRPDASDAQLQAAVAEANRELPDYARIGHWVRARADFTPEAGLATANGRPQRQAIETLHAAALYDETAPAFPS
ncbi:AMP-binding protein [Hydrogenophaga electricum]|uniref:Long-chain acyl-CoA synthetase n=1 Tax=Hydrogenophaga electricum TaxID=1230953 RepID=A0ABQ6CBE2_9BURK|nr:AMP-binding protein [Hydrogenophaga electricum]GLS16105.1 long-chain acyl-CoA synthetase [Hydrogenophaga electricum]